MTSDLTRGLGFRPVTEADRDFLYLIYASTRQEEMAAAGWDKEQVEIFLTQQFNAQHHHYQKYFKDASYEIILLGGEQIGRLYVERRKDEIRLIDLALLPDFRGRGIGSKILRDLIAEAEKANLPLRFHVEYFNPARRLYERLGFTEIDNIGSHFLMEWSPRRREG